MPPIAPTSTAHATAGATLRGSGTDMALRRALMLCGRPLSTLQDQRDCADLLLHAGCADAARLVYEATFIVAGFSSSQLGSQAEIADHTGLWPDLAPPTRASHAPRSGSPIGTAITELASLVAMPADLPSLAELADFNAAASAPFVPDPRGGTATGAVPPPDVAAIPGLVARLHAGLRGSTAGALDSVLREVAVLVTQPPEWILADHHDASLDGLAALHASNTLRRFFLANHDLCRAPFGSPALLAASARLEDSGLGPYFTNVPRLIREGCEVLGLIRLAAGETIEADEERLERWCVLLAGHLDEHQRVGLADHLGDLGLMRALRGVLMAAIRQPGRDRYLYWAIRDAALDNGAAIVAVVAQRAIVGLQPRDATEWMVLGELFGTAGADAAAEAALIAALALAPNAPDLSRRLAALREGSFHHYHVSRGFGTPLGRSALRMKNRSRPRRELRTDAA